MTVQHRIGEYWTGRLSGEGCLMKRGRLMKNKQSILSLKVYLFIYIICLFDGKHNMGSMILRHI
jgi:hypothetical protein